MTEEVKEQILAISRSGETNMFDIWRVKTIARRELYFDLLIFLEEHKDAYRRFIADGTEEAGV